MLHVMVIGKCGSGKTALAEHLEHYLKAEFGAVVVRTTVPEDKRKRGDDTNKKILSNVFKKGVVMVSERRG